MKVLVNRKASKKVISKNKEQRNSKCLATTFTTFHLTYIMKNWYVTHLIILVLTLEWAVLLLLKNTRVTSKKWYISTPYLDIFHAV